tara:strand:- start:16625 stop:17080 length:456 start_codon:yes stop_codon:yes gene_type:complete
MAEDKVDELSIGVLAKASGVKVTTIRFYEQIGLMPEPRRADNDRRVYDTKSVERLSFVKHARQLGFAVESIRALLSMADNPRQLCDEANQLAAGQLSAVEHKIAQLQALQVELQRMVSAACAGHVSECRVIEVLNDHRLCGTEHAEPRALM